MPLALACLLGLLLCRSTSAQPLPVTDLQVHVADPAHLQLEWSPVSQDLLGNPLACVRYDLHLSQTADFTPTEATWLDSSSATSYLHAFQGTQGFYRVHVRSCANPDPGGMRLIPAGSFTMGQEGVYVPEHTVTLTRNYWLGATEVTSARYRAAALWAVAQGLATLAGNALSAHGQGLGLLPAEGTEHPVVNVNWYGAACYCDWLTLQEGGTPYYNGVWLPGPAHDPYSQAAYRLPTEAEWERAARYPDQRRYPWGNGHPDPCVEANFISCAGGTRPVGSHPLGVSALGLQDMAGNAEEWVNDRWEAYSATPRTDPYGPTTGVYCTLRGGGWNVSITGLQSASRVAYHGTGWLTHVGFRVCRTAL